MAVHDVSLPGFLRLAGHPLRWRLLSELSLGDRTVRDLTVVIGRPQSLVSYHLGQLRRNRLVAARRSSADGRDTYYHLDLARCEALLAAAGTALHPGLRLVPADGQPPYDGEPRRVLFLCTGNSARSQIAEALIEQAALGAVVAYSAGSHPKPLHPYAVAVLRTRGIDISNRRSKHLDEFAAQRFEFVVSLCDKVREVCPAFPEHPQLIHWSIADPARIGTTDDETYAAFEATATELAARVGYLIRRMSSTEPSCEAA